MKVIVSKLADERFQVALTGFVEGKDPQLTAEYKYSVDAEYVGVTLAEKLECEYEAVNL